MGKRHRHSSRPDDSSDDDEESERDTKKQSKSKSRHRSRRRRRDPSSSSETDEDSSSSSSYSSSEHEDGHEDEKRRRKRREKDKKRRKDKDKEREEKRRRRKEKERMKKKKKKKEEKSKGAVTEQWGKYGILREIDMWNKRPEFSAWLFEVKKVNLETLPAWEEKQMFKQYMEDYNTATLPSKKYYDIDSYHRQKMMKEMKKGVMKAVQSERTVFNDEEQRRLELRKERERQKEVEIEALKSSMQSGMAQAMKEQAQLREEMNYQYRLGNFEAAAAIQRRLDPDAPT